MTNPANTDRRARDLELARKHGGIRTQRNHPIFAEWCVYELNLLALIAEVRAEAYDAAIAFSAAHLEALVKLKERT